MSLPPVAVLLVMLVIGPHAVRGLTPEERQIVLDTHNKYRAALNATNVYKMEYSLELENWAQLWVDQCFSYHGWPSVDANGQAIDSSGTGQNIHLASGRKGYLEVVSPIDSWHNEYVDYNINDNSCTPGALCGHFTQIVWYRSTQLGCAYINLCEPVYFDPGVPWRTGRIFLCNYKPAGNTQGSYPYALDGAPCSACANGNDVICEGSLCVNTGSSVVADTTPSSITTVNAVTTPPVVTTTIADTTPAVDTTTIAATTSKIGTTSTMAATTTNAEMTSTAAELTTSEMMPSSTESIVSTPSTDGIVSTTPSTETAAVNEVTTAETNTVITSDTPLDNTATGAMVTGTAASASQDTTVDSMSPSTTQIANGVTNTDSGSAPNTANSILTAMVTNPAATAKTGESHTTAKQTSSTSKAEAAVTTAADVVMMSTENPTKPTTGASNNVQTTAATVANPCTNGCRNGGTLDAATCKCTCVTGWQGTSCDESTEEARLGCNLLLPERAYPIWPKLWPILQEKLADVVNRYCGSDVDVCCNTNVGSSLNTAGLYFCTNSNVYSGQGTPKLVDDTEDPEKVLTKVLVIITADGGNTLCPAARAHRGKRQATDLNNAFPQDLLQTAVQQDQAAISQSLQDCCGVELVGVAAATPVTNSPVDTSEQTGLVGWELALVVTAVTIACAGALLCGMIYCNRRDLRRRQWQSKTSHHHTSRRHLEHKGYRENHGYNRHRGQNPTGTPHGSPRSQRYGPRSNAPSHMSDAFNRESSFRRSGKSAHSTNMAMKPTDYLDSGTYWKQFSNIPTPTYFGNKEAMEALAMRKGYNRFSGYNNPPLGY